MSQKQVKSPQLPLDASLKSHQLLEVAQRVVAQCPLELYVEVAITGSVARGKADFLSDVEVIFFVDKTQDRKVYETWMEALDSYEATIPTRTHEEDGFYVLECIYAGQEVGMIWMSWDWLNTQLTKISENPLRSDLQLPWMINHLIPFGTGERLNTFKKRCELYPDSVRNTIIEAHLAGWRGMLAVPHIVFVLNSTYRGQLYDVRRRQFYSIDSLINLLFAYNRRWMVDSKWLSEACETLEYMPEQFVERLNKLLCTADPEKSYELLTSLDFDLFKMLSSEFEVDDILAALKKYRDLGFKHWLQQTS